MKQTTRNVAPLALAVTLIAGCSSLPDIPLLQQKTEVTESLPIETLSPEIAALKEKANQGDPQAQFDLGWAYGEGEGVAQDDSQSVHWYQLAANQGHANAQFNLGVMYDQWSHGCIPK